VKGGRQETQAVDTGRSSGSGFQRLLGLTPEKMRRLERGLVDDYLAQLRHGAGWSKASGEKRRWKRQRKELDD
jgi:hypothetical protein